ncbi:TMEM165/GDT1 family protein [Halomarina pelagica]|uniref:TMEM165/GDT1 family protein n=1 Tax=Halomarina pelagica TaxID=2961599 RepID=UPI0020C530ED|nr:TMEM165/GDT1 family protein [Halomarina sp. BND7]
MTVAQPGVDAVVSQYAGYGPLVAAFLVNLLATVGDKGQLVVVTLASRYDAKKVFLGAMGAFALWSALEVALGAWLVRVLPGGLIAPLTGGLFVAFGLWTARSAYRRTSGGEASGPALTGGGLDVGLTGRLLPDGLLRRLGTYGGVLASFAFVLVAEFGDKTQLLTIDLAATFPDAPLSVFVGVIAALALRTGIDALVGERVERWLPTRAVEAAAAAVFLAFGLLVLGVLPATGLLAVLAVVVLGLLGWAVAAGR